MLFRSSLTVRLTCSASLGLLALTTAPARAADAGAGAPASSASSASTAADALPARASEPAADPALAKAAQEPGAIVTASGLVYRSLKDGTGASPTATDRVKVHYRGTFTDGREFDSSYKRGQPLEFALDRVIKCWTEGVQRMKVGGKARFTCPPGIAYGDKAVRGVIPPNATLQFEVELLGVNGH